MWRPPLGTSWWSRLGADQATTPCTLTGGSLWGARPHRCANSRGRDRPGLEESACPCYGIVKAEFDALTSGPW